MSHSHAMRPGERIGERFEIEAPAGEGGMGVVYRARDLVRGQRVALKVLKGAFGSRLLRFGREASVLAELRHAAIAQYHDHGKLPDGSRYLVMEWLDGPTLADRLLRQPLDLEETLAVAIRIADALGTAHAAGIVHRDVKPANIMLAGDDAREAKLLDFGLARQSVRGVESITETGMFMGTLRYMAPEQARDAKSVDARADVYALGAVIFECLAGRPAIADAQPCNVLAKIVLEPPPRISTHVPEISPAIDELLAAMMAKDPADRPADGWCVRSLLEQLRGSSAVLPSRLPGITPRERRLMWVMLIADAASVDEPTLVLGATVPIAGDDTTPSSLVEAHGGELQQLADGTLLITFSSERTSDEPWRAATTALSWRTRYPTSRIALAAGPGVQLPATVDSAGPRPQVGEVIDRATAALTEAAAGTIRLEPAAKTLLERRFVIHGDVLVAQRIGDELPHVLGRRHACVGRTRELLALTAMLQESLDDRVARAALIRGEAGIGKSRVLHELANLARDIAGLCTVRGGVDALQDGAPFALMRDVLRNLAGIADDDPLETARDKLERRVAEHVPAADRARVSAFLGEVASVPFAPEGALAAARNDAVLMGDSMQSAVEDFFAAEVAAHPVLVMLEDVHWADGPSLRILRAVLRRLHDQPFTVVASGRPEARFEDVWQSMGADVIALQPLGRAASERLTAAILGDRLGADVAARLAKKSGGNPLFIEELARAAVHGREDLADTILGAVQARLDEVDGTTRLVLRAAAVFGLRFWVRGVHALAPSTDPMVLEDCLAELEHRELIARSRASSVAKEREYSFVHDLVRDGAYAMLTHEDRQRGHALAGAWLEDAGARDAEMLAGHFELGGSISKALPWLMQAARQALDGNDFERAVARADTALAADGDVVAMCIVKAEALRHLGRHRESMTCAVRAVAQAPAGASVWFRAAIELALSSAHSGASEEVARVCGDLRNAAPVPGTIAHKVSALCVVGWMLQQVGRVELAYDLVDDAERLADTHGIDDPLSRAHLSGVRAVRAYNAGNLAGYLRESERAQDGYGAAGDKRRSCGQGLNVVVGYISVGCFDRARDVATALLDVVRRLGLRGQESFALGLLSNAQLELGDLEAAARTAEEARSAATDERHIGFSEMLLGRISSARGEHDEALARFAMALRAFESSPSYRVHALAALAHTHVRRGDAHAGLSCAEQAHELAVGKGIGGASSGQIALVRAEALAALGRRQEAAVMVQEACRDLEKRAAAFDDAWLRSRFLEGIAAHARLRELERELSSPT